MKIEVEGGRQFSEQLIRWIKVKSLTVGEALRDETKQLLRLVIRLVPPQRGKTQGELAVSRDVARAVYPLMEDDFDKPDIKSMIRKKDYPALQKMVANFAANSPARNATVVPFSGSYHEQKRDRRGRVMDRTPEVATPDEDEMGSYIKKRNAAVGQGKGGFVAGLEAMGGTAPRWIARHKRFGDVVDRSNDLLNPYIDVNNRSRWASSGDQDRIVANATRTRASVIRKKVDDALAKASKQTGLD